MPDLEKKVLRQYKRRQRRQRWIARAPKFVAWVIGLDLTTTIVYGGGLVYQRVLDDEKRLNALFEKNARARKAAQASALAAATRSMTANDIWMPGTWELAAQQYINAQIAQTVSSANPPRHRHQFHD